MASTIKEIKNPWLRTLAEYGLITVSIWIMVIGIYFFKFPNHFAFGGVTGFSTVFSQLLHCSGPLCFEGLHFCKAFKIEQY